MSAAAPCTEANTLGPVLARWPDATTLGLRPRAATLTSGEGRGRQDHVEPIGVERELVDRCGHRELVDVHTVVSCRRGTDGS